jgi:Spy/CpxP family protein refolding chaperone
MRFRTIIFAAVLAVSAPATAQQPSDPIGEAFFAPELVMQHHQAIALTDDQKESLRRTMREAQLRFTDLQWNLQDEVGEMVTLIGTPRVDEVRVLAQLQKVLAAEREVKQTQITLLVRIKNLLTEAQQEQLRRLRTGAQP